MTPNIGQGANTAIEDAAALASLIHQMINPMTPQNASKAAIGRLFQKFQDLRMSRVQSTVQRAHFGARFHTRDDHLKALVGRYIFPYVGNLVMARTVKVIGGGHKIEFLPPPKRSMPWTAQTDHSQHKMHGSKVLWAYLCVSTLVLYAACALFQLM